MSGFVIFVLVLTFAYMVYYAAVITLDVHGNTDEKKQEEETIDVSSMSDEEHPVEVEERGNDLDRGVATYTEQMTEDGLRVIGPSGHVPQSSIPLVDDEPEPEQAKPGKTSEELNAEHEENMEAIETGCSISMVADEFEGKLKDKNKRKIEKKCVRDEL